MFENYRVFEYTLAGRPLKVETGKMAGLANGSCLIRYGDTAVLCCATASARPRDGIDFLPLSVDFEERLYAAGKIPGGYLKREGRPSEKAILASRVIDRPIRPLFPKDLRNDVSLSLTVMSVDQDCSPEISAMIGASIALSISDIPWNGPDWRRVHGTGSTENWWSIPPRRSAPSPTLTSPSPRRWKRLS